ncbi:myo-inositol 2-dehydrogenase / D-chiro-inositol 1-dehydrogenase [Marmoricola sp. URHA0025 HA25]
MRIAVLGTGLMARVRAAHLLADQRVSWVGIASANIDRAARLARELGAAFSGEIEEVLAERPDALVVAGSSDDHASHIRLGLGLGLPVLTEKPLAIDLEDCRAIVRESENAGVGVQIGFQRRFDHEYSMAKTLLDDGTLGRLYGVRLISHDHQPPSELFVSGSGGLFRDLGVHDYDLARWLTGEEVVQVFAVGANRTDRDYFATYNDVDTALTVLTMESGIGIVVSSARHSPDGHDVRAELYGSRHNVVVGYDEHAPLRNADGIRGGATLSPCPDFLSRFREAFGRETSAFVTWTSGEAENPCPAINGLESLRIATAAAMSCQLNRPVELTEV